MNIEASPFRPEITPHRLILGTALPLITAFSLIVGVGELPACAMTLGIAAAVSALVGGGIWGLLLLAFPFAPKIAAGLGNIYVSTLLVLAAVFFWFITLLRRRGLSRPLPARLLCPLVVFLSLLLVSALAHLHDLRYRPADLMRLVQLMAYLLLLPMVYDLAPTGSRLRFLLYLPLAVGAAQAVYALGFAPVGARGFLAGSFDHEHNNFAAEMVLVFSLGLGLFLGRSGWMSRVVSACILLPVGVALLLSQSRTGMIAMAFALLSALVLPIGRRTRLALLGLFAVGGVIIWIFLPPELKERAASIPSALLGQGEDLALSRRLAMWQDGWWSWRSHWWWGSGIWSRPLMDNYFLKVAVEMGIVGLSAFIWLIAAVLREAWVMARRHEIGGGLEMSPGLWMSTIALLFVMNLSGDYFLIHRVMGTFWLLLGLLLRARAEVVDGSEVRLPA